MRVRGLSVWLGAALAGVAIGCGESEIREDAEAAAKAVRDNPPDAAELYEETYDEKRKKGEGRVEAGGEAYEAVLEVPE